MHFSSQMGFWPNTAMELTLDYVAQRSPKVMKVERIMVLEGILFTVYSGNLLVSIHTCSTYLQ